MLYVSFIVLRYTTTCHLVKSFDVHFLPTLDGNPPDCSLPTAILP